MGKHYWKWIRGIALCFAAGTASWISFAGGGEAARLRYHVVFAGSVVPAAEYGDPRLTRAEVLRKAGHQFRSRAHRVLERKLPGLILREDARYYWVSGVVSLLLTEDQVLALRSSRGDDRDGDVLAVERADRRAFLLEPDSHAGPVAAAVRNEPSWGLLKIGLHDVQAAWPELTGKGVRVGILDTGVDGAHPDLTGRVRVWKDFVGPGEGAAPLLKPYDDHGHGTHVAGTIAADGAGGTAVGVAPGTDLVVGKVMNQYGSSTWEAIAGALQWVMDPDGNPETDDFPLIVSNSWGVGIPSEEDSVETSEFCIAVRNWRNAGILPVFAAGNFGPSVATVAFPAACPGALAVGASDIADRIAFFSSRGPSRWKGLTLDKPDLVAPGVDIVSLKNGGGYATKSGTSMATPHVAAVAALVVAQSEARKPGVRVGPDELSVKLTGSAQGLGDAGFDFTYGWGRLNAARSLGLDRAGAFFVK